MGHGRYIVDWTGGFRNGSLPPVGYRTVIAEQRGVKARQGPTSCSGMTVPMEKLDDLVASHLEERLLQPDRLQMILSAVMDRREERTTR